MVAQRQVSVGPVDVLLLVGTQKGAFILSSSRTRKEWNRGGPFFPGHSVPALAYDGRAGRHRLWAATHSFHWGATLSSSEDFGKTWTPPQDSPIKFPTETGASLKQIWQIALGSPSSSETLYCGVEPAALFGSQDSGRSWSLVRGIYDHPHRSRWEPGGGGLCLHTILPNPAQTASDQENQDAAEASWKAFGRSVKSRKGPAGSL
jgi:hypothetical protein